MRPPALHFFFYVLLLYRSVILSLFCADNTLTHTVTPIPLIRRTTAEDSLRCQTQHEGRFHLEQHRKKSGSVGVLYNPVYVFFTFPSFEWQLVFETGTAKRSIHAASSIMQSSLSTIRTTSTQEVCYGVE